MRYILALDQGTTSTRAILFDKQLHIRDICQKTVERRFPKPGWVEQDPLELLSSAREVMESVLQKTGVKPEELAGIGITNQREATVLWERETGRPVYPVIGWQCRRTAEICGELEARGLAKEIRSATGLMLDAYFSATKLMWLLRRDNLYERAKRGELLFGTVDSWLIWNLTKGKEHVTDHTNASRTMLYNLHTRSWDKRLLEAFDIPEAVLPTIKESRAHFGKASLLGGEVPILGVAGDQQAALFGQCCFKKGEGKNTYGTGCFLLVNTGEKAVESQEGLLATAALGPEGRPAYALEGSVFTGGALLQWLVEGLGILGDVKDAAYFAQKVADTGNVFLVPAFSGLGAPYWDMYARGCLIGVTSGTKREHIIRAAEESIAYQTRDLVRAMEKDMGSKLEELNVDGGASRDPFLMQFQSDILAIPVRRPMIRETTALGAAYLAGLESGVWAGTEEIKSLWRCDSVFTPGMDELWRKNLLLNWHKAVSRSLHWASAET